MVTELSRLDEVGDKEKKRKCNAESADDEPENS